MLFALVLLIILGAIVFVHYIQGFFSASISAILAVVAAVVAFSYHESLVPLFGGKAADYSSPICLLALFAITYLVLRLIFDRTVPGNVRLPLAVDKGGAIVMGLIAGIFATGIVAIAAQEFPFGPSIAGFGRYDTADDHQVTVQTTGRAFYSKVYNELKVNSPGTPGSDEHGMPILPVDNIVVNMVNKLSSDSGSLSNGKPLDAVHPDFLGEMFDQRLGIEPGASHVATNGQASNAVRVTGLFDVDAKIPQADGEVNWIRPTPLPKVALKPNEIFLAVRVMFDASAGDTDNNVRFSPGTCRLLLHDPQADDPQQEYKDYFPVGTLEGTTKLFLNKLDDYLFCQAGHGADLVYVVPKNLFMDREAKPKGIPEGSFLEIKRWARVDLSGMKLQPSGIKPDPNVVVLRKDFLLHPKDIFGQEVATTPNPHAAPAPKQQQQQAAPAQAQTPKSSAAPAGESTFVIDRVLPSIMIPNPLAVPMKGPLPGNGTAVFKEGLMQRVVLDAPNSELKEPRKVGQFSVPDGQAMVQVIGSPTSWAFATEPENYELVDSTGKHYQPNGVYVNYPGAGGEHTLLRYIDQTGISGQAAPEGNPKPSLAVLLYNVPQGVTLKEFDDHGQKTKDLNVVARD